MENEDLVPEEVILDVIPEAEVEAEIEVGIVKLKYIGSRENICIRSIDGYIKLKHGQVFECEEEYALKILSEKAGHAEPIFEMVE